MTSTTNPYADLVDSIKRAMEYPVPLKLRPMNKDGDVCFAVPLSVLSWSSTSLNSLIFYSHAFANIIGEILVNSNHLKAFDDVIASEFYPKACENFRHTGFGLRIAGQNVEFFLHCSFLTQLFNHFLAKELEEAQKDIINIPAEKKKRSDDLPSIVSCADDKSFKVIVSKQGNLEHSISTAVSAILEHYGVSKDVRVTMGQFQMELETVDL